MKQFTSSFCRSLSLSVSLCSLRFWFCSLWHHASRTILATHIHTPGLALPNTLFAVYCQITYKHNIFSIKQIPMFINHPSIHSFIHPPTLLLPLLLLPLPCRHIQFHCAPVHISHWLIVLPCCCCFFHLWILRFFVSVDCRAHGCPHC